MTATLWRRVRYLLRRQRHDEELAADLEFHRQMAEAAGRSFPSTLRTREEAREAWGWMWLDRLGQDLRYGVRQMRRSPGFTCAAVLTLMLGIGINVAAFSFFNVVLLRPLPVRDPGSLRRFLRAAPQAFSTDLPYLEAAFFREHSRTLSTVLPVYEAQLVMGPENTRVHSMFVTPDYFTDLGATPAVGRFFETGNDREPGVVLGFGFWQRRFGGDPAVVGKTVLLNGKAVPILGVTSARFSGLKIGENEAWLTLDHVPELIRGSQLLHDISGRRDSVQLWGRLAPGVSPRAAEEELRSLAAALRLQYPKEMWENESLPSEPGGYASLSGGHSAGTAYNPPTEAYATLALGALLGMLIFVVACANLGSLLLARSLAREREMSIRAAVGAGRLRLVRQIFTESLLLAGLGAMAALGFATATLCILLQTMKAPAWFDPTPDWRVYAFCVLLGAAAALLFGLTPAFQIARERHPSTRFRPALVACQIGASCVLLIVAGLLVRAIERAVAVDPGFAYQRAFTIDAALDQHGYSGPEARVYVETLQRRLLSLPGVRAVGLTTVPPLGHKRVGASGDTEKRRPVNAQISHVDAAFFTTMKLPVLRGRVFQTGERLVMIVSDSLARRAWPGEDPLGKQIQFGDDKFTVVGIAGDARLTTPQDADTDGAYFPLGADDWTQVSVVAATNGAPEPIVASASQLARSLDETLFPQIELMKESFQNKLQGASYAALGVSSLGAVALVLACLGIVGLVAYTISQRTKEIGIRMALGARPSHLLLLLSRQLLRPLLFGLLGGIGVAAAVSRLLSHQLYGLSHLDPVAYAGATLLFLVLAGLAGLVPARRAITLDPVPALRSE